MLSDERIRLLTRVEARLDRVRDILVEMRLQDERKRRRRPQTRSRGGWQRHTEAPLPATEQPLQGMPPKP